jgi:hypothetical protein
VEYHSQLRQMQHQEEGRLADLPLPEVQRSPVDLPQEPLTNPEQGEP